MEAFLKLTNDIYVLDIPKNGSSLIKALILGKDENADIEDIHNKGIGYVIDNIHTFDSSKYVEGLKVAIYRDPVDRLVSVYTDKVLNPDKRSSLCKTLMDNNIHSLDSLIDYVSIPENLGERHLKPQYKYIEESYPLDLIVPLESLSKWVKEEVHLFPFIANRSKFKYVPNKEQIERIREIYAEDYKILKNHKIYDR